MPPGERIFFLSFANLETYLLQISKLENLPWCAWHSFFGCGQSARCCTFTRKRSVF